MAPRQHSIVDHTPVPRKRNPITGYRVPHLIKQGEIVCDVTKKKWRLGKSIGVGAFGDIYLASDDITKPVGSEAKYVIKMEPHSSGPLFVEMNFYLRATTSTTISSWTLKKRTKNLGIPTIYGFGSHLLKGERMRFIVIPKYGESIHKLFTHHSNCFHVKSALTLASCVMDVLEYIHSHGYIHSDIKGLNIVLGEDTPVYLIDFGLVCRFRYNDGTHKDFTPDGRKADVGTIEYSGRDAHYGVVTRRSDLESLGYNIVSWLGGKLPWENCYDDSEVVTQMKEEAIIDIKSFLDKSFSSKPLLESTKAVLMEYLEYVSQMDFNAEPDYSYCKSLFRHGITSAGFEADNKLTFDSHAKLTKRATNRLAGRENRVFKKKKRILNITNRKPCSIHNHNMSTPRITRAVDKMSRKTRKTFDWASVLASNPETFFRRDKPKLITPSKMLTPMRAKGVERVSDLSNPTSAMLSVIEKRKRRFPDASRRHRSDSCSIVKGESCTPAMEEIIAKRNNISHRVLRSSSLRVASKK